MSNKWIRVEDRLPEYDKPILIMSKYSKGLIKINTSMLTQVNAEITLGCFNPRCGWSAEGSIHNYITHWCEIPEFENQEDVNEI